jgi:DNA (cytosine-5)-methyltransferase 1
MKGGTLFSGIGAPECAMPSIDWRWCAEIDPFASAVHAARFLRVVNLGDVEQIDAARIEPVDLVVFGSPCQSFSVAGKRLGLDDPRGNLALVGLRLIGKLRPRWVVWENVPGVLSSDGGRDFGAFLGLLGELGYGFAYAVLDAQHFGVPQRRRRVFVVGCLGDWRGPAAVLFDPESLRGDSAPRPQTRQAVAGSLGAGSKRSGKRLGRREAAANHLIAFSAKDDGSDAGCVSPTLRADMHHGKQGNGGVMPAIAHSLRVDGFDASEDGTGRGTPLVAVTISNDSHTVGDVAGTLFAKPGSCQPMPLTLAIRGRGDSHDLEYRDDGTANAILTPNGGRAGIGVGAVAFHENQRAETTLNDTAGSLKTGGGKPGQGYPATMHGMSVRRLTPRECERLQGFPDFFTAISYRGKPAADGPRYRALGNSMAVPVIKWIGERIRRLAEQDAVE